MEGSGKVNTATSPLRDEGVNGLESNSKIFKTDEAVKTECKRRFHEHLEKLMQEGSRTTIQFFMGTVLSGVEKSDSMRPLWMQTLISLVNSLPKETGTYIAPIVATEVAGTPLRRALRPNTSAKGAIEARWDLRQHEGFELIPDSNNPGQYIRKEI